MDGLAKWIGARIDGRVYRRSPSRPHAPQCAGAQRDRQSGRSASPETRLHVSRRATRVRGLPENYFDDWIAPRYDVLWSHLFDPEVVEPAVSFLADLAGDGRALELGIGTGRLALPLSRRGIRVDGIELSAAMVEQLRSQPGSSDIDVTIGDFSTTKVNGTFTLAYLVRNTIMNLTSQDAQVECFLNVARHLEPGGCFVIEVIVPPWQRLAPGETVIPFDVSPAHLGFDEIDVATQNSWSHHYWFVDGDTKTFSAPFRYVWPSELDLMARLAGMALRERWSDWNREPFTDTSRSHISVWQKPASAADLADDQGRRRMATTSWPRRQRWRVSQPQPLW